MIKSIWKYPLEVIGRQVVKMPKGAQILSVQIQNETICIWAMVDKEAEKENRIFEIFGTGSDIVNEAFVNKFHIGTTQVQEGHYIFHVFEVVKA